MAEIYGPPHAESLWDKYRRIVRVVVKETCIPVPIIVAENDSGTIGRDARVSSRPRSRQEQDENDGDQYSADQQECRPGCVHTYNPFDGERAYIHSGKRISLLTSKLR